jgi:hypothetical protein
MQVGLPFVLRTQLYPKQPDGGVYFIKSAKAIYPHIIFINPLAAKKSGGACVTFFGIYFHVVDLN